MSSANESKPLASRDDLLSLFHSSVRTDPATLLVGPEHEKFGVLASGMPLPYDSGVQRVLDALVSERGWTSEYEKPGGPRIALKRGAASVTLEPGGQLELSGAAVSDVHAIEAEMVEHLAEIDPVSRELGVHWLGIGFHPFATLADFPRVNKARYIIMREYLTKQGSHGLDMMHRTCTVQGNYDYTSEADALRKVRIGMKLSPLCAAMFANSPWIEGKPHGGVSFRAKVWLDVDADRTGLVPSIWGKEATFGTYVDWALDVPMFLFKRNGEVVANTGQTFRSFLADGFQGHRATEDDWQTHLNTLFPEVRLKRTIEIRSADSQGRHLASALPALYTGLYYDARALDLVDELTEDWTHDEISELRERVWRDGLRAKFRGAPLAATAERVLDIAMAGLDRRNRRDASGRTERVYVERLMALASRGTTPADELLAATRDATSADELREAIVRATSLASA